MLAKWPELPYKYKSNPMNWGDGINLGTSPFNIGDSELTDCQNLDSRVPGALNVRPLRKIHSSITTPVYVGQRMNQDLIVVDGTTLKYWNGSSYVTLKTGLTNTSWGKVEDFETGTGIVTLFSNGYERFKIDGATVTDITQFPATPFFCVLENRVFALKGNILYYSVLGDCADFTTGAGADAGSGDIVITNTKGDPTAVHPYGGNAIIFSLFSMFELWGSGPPDFNLKPISFDVGCFSQLTIKEIDGRLFWYGKNSVYMYTGSQLPEDVSDKVKPILARATSGYYYKARAGTDGRRYYLALPIDGSTTNNCLLVFDTKTGIWHVENGAYVNFTEINYKLYGLSTGANIWDMVNGGGTDETIIWYCITKPNNESTIGEKKNWQKLNIIVTCPVGSTLNIGLSTKAEGDNFTTIKSIPASADIQSQEILIPLTIAQNADYVRLKFSGTGPCTVHEAERQLRIIKR